MTIKLNRPYRILTHRTRQYQRHYGFPARDALIVPRKIWDNQASCEVHWEDERGMLRSEENKMFTTDNLVPLNELVDHDLYEVWLHYYVEKNRATSAIVNAPG